MKISVSESRALPLCQRKARIARALLAADLADEAISALREATLAYLQAAEITIHRAEPANLTEALRPPYDATRPTDIHSAIQALNAGTITADAATPLTEWLLRA